jgi:DNA-binding GntR family transcriptional regulator
MMTLDTQTSLLALWEQHSAAAGAAESVHATLRSAITSGLVGPGESLIEEHVARQFGISRTPVREALLRLEAEGLASRVPRRGLVVRTVSEREILEGYTVRAHLDSLAAHLAATEASPVEIAQLRWLNQRLAESIPSGDVLEMSNRTNAFHLALARAAHNGVLLQFAEQMQDWVKHLGLKTYTQPGRPQASLAEHEQLLLAIERHDPDAAEQIAREHMANARQVRIAITREQEPQNLT